MTKKLAQPRQTGQDNLTLLAMETLARSALHNEIKLYRLGDFKLPKWALIGGVHGDEPEGALLVEDFLAQAAKHLASFKSSVIVIPRYNPDGLNKNERVNGNGVDLNRNFPSSDWSHEHSASRYYPGQKPSSETETQALVKLLLKEKPFLVVHCHTYIPQMNYTGEISKKWAELLAQKFPHPITDNIGYPTPGSLGQFCHLTLKTACVCIELPEQVSRKKAWELVGDSLLEVARHAP
jgi:protein MpaA